MEELNLMKNDDEILRLIEETVDDTELEDTPYEEEDEVESEIDNCDEDPNWEPEDNRDNLAEKLQEDIKKILQKIKLLEERKETCKSKKIKRSVERGDATNTSKKANQTEDDGVSEEAQEAEGQQLSSDILNFPRDSVKVSWNKGKSEYEWQCHSQVKIGKIPRKNIVNIRPGPTSEARDKLEPMSCFNLFFTDDIIAVILTHTNSEIKRQRVNYKDNNSPTHGDLCLPELKAFFGLLVLSAALKDNHVSTEILFDPTYCGNRYKTTMSEKRFKFIGKCLRFDDRETRVERSKENRLAPISEIWNVLMANCEKNYRPSMYVTIDEQLVGFRGKCKFRMYIPSKPDKYGLKIIMMCDNSSKYMVSAMPPWERNNTYKHTSS